MEPAKARTRGRRLIALLAGVGLSVSACVTAPAAPLNSEIGEIQGALRIFAAASLADPFAKIADEFAKDHPDVELQPISFDGSSTLATQILEGAPADVFAAADDATMDRVGAEAQSRHIFATNRLEIAVQPGNPLRIASLADATTTEVQLVLCAPQVPCGAAAHRLFNLANLSPVPVSEEQSVTAVLAKVRLGEADAGLVYSTDILAAGGAATGVLIEGAERATNSYPIATLRGSAHPRVAAAFVMFVLSERGQAILASYGFGAP